MVGRRGRLRQQVRFEKPTKVADGVGGFTGGPWLTHCTEPAEIERLRSIKPMLEQIRAGGQSTNLMVNIHVRCNALTSAITTDMRAYDVGQNLYFNVNAVQDIDGSGREITITATQNAPA